MTIQSPGIVSGIDINALVGQLVAAERAPAQLRLDRQGRRIDTQISALGTLRSSLSTLNGALGNLRTEGAFQAKRATSSETAVFTATALGSAAPGSYSIEVLNRASAQRLTTAPYVGGPTTVIGTGTLTIASAGRSFQVSIQSSNNTLEGIRDAINAAPDNRIVQANIVRATDGARLVLAARDTGAANALTVAVTGGDPGLEALRYQPGTATSLIPLTPAADARIRIEGFEATSSTNSFANVVDGVTLNVVSERPGTVLNLTVSNDTSAVEERVQKFVTDFNALASTIGQLRSFNPATRVAGPLLGDALLRSLESSLRRDLASPVAGATPPYDSLAAIGITTTSGGTLTVNATRLREALATDFNAVGRLFGGTGGVGARLSTIVGDALRADSQLATREQTLQGGKRGLERDREALDRRMASVEQRIRAQFTAMDKLLAGLQSTGSFLSQQLSRLP